MKKPTTLVGKMVQERLKALEIGEGRLKSWAIANDVSYQQVWSNARGDSVSKDPFIVKLASRLGVDPVYAVLTAHADRVAEPFKGYFLAARQRYVDAPQLERAWLALDPETREALLEVIGDPERARTIIRIHKAL